MPEHRSIPRDKRISHLSNEDYRDLFDCYHHSEIKVSKLITKFNLKNIPISGLRFILSYREYRSNCCPVHNVYSWQKASGRNKWSIPFCPECKVSLWSDFNSKTNSLYKGNTSRPEKPTVTIENVLNKLDYERLNYKQKIIIVAWFIESLQTLPVLNAKALDEICFFPSELMKQVELALFAEQNLLLKNHISDLLLDDELFDQFKSANYDLDENEISIYNLWWDIAYNEILDYFIYELEKKNLPSELNKNYLAVIQYLTSNLPIQQAMFAIWASVKDSCSVIAEKNWDLVYAERVVSDNLKKKANRLIEGTLKHYPFSRPYSCQQSKLSKVFSEIVFGQKDEYFTEIPNMKTISKVKEDESKIRERIQGSPD